MSFIEKLCFILLIMIDFSGFSRQKNFSGPNWAYFCLLIDYLDLDLQTVFYFTYYDRKQLFLVGTGGFSRLNFSSVLIKTYFQIVSKFVLRL